MDSLDPDSPVAAAATSRPPRVWKFRGTALWGLFIFAAMFIGQVAPVLAIVIWRTGKIDMVEIDHVAHDGRMLALTVIFGLPAVLAATWLPVHLSRTPFKEYLALRWTTWQNVVIGIVAMIVVVEGWDLLSRATGHEVTAGFMGDILKSATADGVLWLAVLAFAVVAPFTEELLARGFLYRGWSESFLRVPGAIVLSSLVWTAMHVQYDLFFLGEVFSIGIVLGYIRYRSQSIWLTTLLHGLNNLAALIQTIVMTQS
ncbi:MAG: CPBP family intramembrane metalloprotease [Bradyrhizobium sp.]|uniref:CPBP family intramembrane glutamic endopeptidase n=1 Tax=Bradyrhizobium sp. TaxID=376 RepID=UPI001C29BD09|nr:CPBP family intramembrane glutamic endopeptidase [Bradyrhizobium sp.]MBU6465017.1 CPBP family intramembrane metalloprotease [Pseudomonadota bacterium]MDE2066645.1 CPBP family intramembrane metalloprotease [Bradyrhizobium sp.]MDE2242818.1 CPBP family intramembrane metalloprotease [Bradyrhizobium sp.]MDE2469278.1 CPBP family intramembrane metalloprotease [Bradyrhizobium sp.]